MIKRPLLLIAVAVLVSSTTFAAQSALSVPVGGNFVDAFGGVGTFTGQFRIVQFAAEGNQVVAQGFVSGILTDSRGHVVTSLMQAVSMPVGPGSRTSSKVGIEATCPILHLDLGPIHLDLLGLRVDLSEVVLDITAQSGPGNLLGNLLCAITNLLNGSGNATTLADLLNQLLRALTNLLG